MPFKEFILKTIVENQDLFPCIKPIFIPHEAIQHFYSDLISYQMSLLGYDISYFAFPQHKGVANLADGGFLLNHLHDISNNLIPIQYKMKSPTVATDILNMAISERLKYQKTSSIIELGIQNWDMINSTKIDLIPNNVLIVDYSHLNNPAPEEFKNLVKNYINYKKNNNIYNVDNINEITKNYGKNYSNIISNSSNNSSIIEIIKKSKGEI